MGLLPLFNRLARARLLRGGAAARTVEVLGNRVHFYDLPGDESVAPTLLIHGLGATSHTWLRTFFPLAKRLGRVVALDWPGVGFSQLPPGKTFATVWELADAIEAFGAAVFDQPALLVGHSLGGAMALHLAARQTAATRWRAVVAMCPAGAHIPHQEAEALRRSFLATDRAGARALLKRVMSASSLGALPLWLVDSDFLAHLQSEPMRELVESFAPEDALAPAELARISIPALILWGAAEQLLPRSMADYYRANLPPHAKLEVVPRWTHMPQTQRPREVVERIARFGRGASHER